MEIQENDFECIFSELLDQSKVFTIKYNPKPLYYKEHAFMDYTIVGVNDCGSEWEFKAHYRALIKAGMSKLSLALEKESHDGKIGLLEYIYEEFSALKDYVVQKEYSDEETEWGPEKLHRFSAFQQTAFVDNSGARPRQSLLIERKIEEFAKAWVEIIDEGKQKLNFLINIYESMPKPPETVKDKDTIILFYSWQTDNPDTRSFIWKGIREIEKAFEKEGKKLKVESDMRETSGSQNIPATIFEKIEASDIFLADVNIVAKSLTRENNFSPNPNVMIELGFAAAKLGWDKIIMVMDTEQYKIEDLPFDIRQRSILWHTGKNLDQLTGKLKGFISAIAKKKV
ncbi:MULTISPECIES: hypothetical protein [Sphingobacterium]|uniref:hypothetical protein n=1 Tax=Sphingobacterium TaxID=28453 RepID=UPI00257DC83D|nr:MULTISPECIES: hypothetical protein [Sphingobacterium]